DGKTARAEAEVEQFVHVGARLQKDVLADDADVRRAVLDVDGHVAGLYEQIAHALLRVLEHELAPALLKLRASAAELREELIYFVAEASLRQCDVQHGDPSVSVI